MFTLFETYIEKSENKKEDAQESKPIQLLDLPVEVLEMVMTTLDVGPHEMIRDMSEEMKQISNSFLMHRHRRLEVAHRERPAESVRNRDARFVLQIMRLICTYFDDENSESDFALCLLLYFDFKQFQYDVKDTLTYFVMNFIRHKEKDPFKGLKLKRFQYAMTVLGLLREFENVKILGLKHLVDWNLEVELPNTFIGIIEEGNVVFRTTWKSNRRISFLVVLAELLFYEKSKTSYTGQRNFDGIIYTYSIQPNSVAKSAPRLLLKFIVDGPPLLIYFMNNFLTRNKDPNTPYHLLSKTHLTIRIEGKAFPGTQFVYFKDLNIDVLKSDLSTR